MAIAKTPRRQSSATVKTADDDAARFIAGATKETPTKTTSPVMVRMSPELLARVDTQAKRRGLTRAGWIKWAVTGALEEAEG